MIPTRRRTVILVTTILVGLGLRLSLALIPGYVGDQAAWGAMARNVVTNGWANAYTLTGRGIYPPLYHLALGMVGFIYQHFFSSEFIIGTFKFNFLFKAFPILGDCLLALALYAVVRDFAEERVALSAAMFLMFNPGIVFDSAYWGMFGDSIYTLFIVLSLWAIQRGQPSAAWFWLILGLNFKPQAIFFLPLIAWVTLRALTWERCLRIAATISITLAVCRRGSLAPRGRPRKRAQGAMLRGLSDRLLAVIWLPFVIAGTAADAIRTLSKTAGLGSELSANAHNLWYFAAAGHGEWKDLIPIVGPLNARVLGLILLGAAYLLALVRLKDIRNGRLFASAAFIAFSSFVLLTEMHENYLYPTVVLVAGVWGKSRPLMLIATIVSITLFVNIILHDPFLRGLAPIGVTVFLFLAALNSSVNLLTWLGWTIAPSIQKISQTRKVLENRA